MTEKAIHSTDTPAPPQRNKTPRRAHGKLLTAGLFGSSIEWYDFFLYGTAAALVFPHVFFPEASALTGTLLSFSTFWAGFIARPLGGLIAGHYGDKYGRKPALLTCLILMGAATFLIGCLPSTAQIGVWAPVLLVTLRFAQGLACGGQWGGIMLLLTESANPKRRGFSGTFGQVGASLGIVLGNLAFLGATAAISTEAFFAWGWRVPFLFSALLFPVVWYIHTKVEDTPEFRDLQQHSSNSAARVVQAPLTQALTQHWRTILLASGLMAVINAIVYINIAGILSYGTTELGHSRNDLLRISLLATAISAGVIVWGGSLSDKLGRRPVVLTGAGLIVLWAFPYFWLVNTGSLMWCFVAVTVGSLFYSLAYGPIAAYIGELFAPNVRYSAASVAYQLPAITVSGGTPFIMTAIIAHTGSTTWVSAFIAAMGVLTVLCAARLPETNSAAVRNDPAAVPGQPSTP
ncbi:MFS transporter [Rhodococcus wratislaviensis]|uniref:Putative major facilitator superfamily transporter n=1 Tax=Rhodococcus wratislaviensis NBRC 100605 TaxID=1219028 RepID=X0PY27_RHOWR|nr:MFS transporter [Rhodococcus wratislaviensis]GAF48338.1 putative major facilitator superfamily transporter [Rhodococcus wratislaviensis NBRC 100605]